MDKKSRMAIVSSVVWPLIVIFASEPWNAGYRSDDGISAIFWFGLFPVIIYWSYVYIKTGRFVTYGDEETPKSASAGGSQRDLRHLVVLEIKARKIDPQLWQAALSECEGDKKAAKKKYIRLRLEKLMHARRKDNNDRQDAIAEEFSYENLDIWRKAYIWLHLAGLVVAFFLLADESEAIYWMIYALAVPYTAWVIYAISKRKVIQLWILAVLSTIPFMAPLGSIILALIAVQSAKEIRQIKTNDTFGRIRESRAA